jgi:hypothetical protein
MSTLVHSPTGTAGYDYVEYYYLPDIGVYYFVPPSVRLHSPVEMGVFGHLPSAIVITIYTADIKLSSMNRELIATTNHISKYAKYKGHPGKNVKKVMEMEGMVGRHD